MEQHNRAALDRYGILDRYVAYNARRRGVLGRLMLGLKRAAAAGGGALVTAIGRSHARTGSARCDVLFIHGWVGGPTRVAALERELAGRGLSVQHHVRAGRGVRLLRRWLAPPSHWVPSRWRLETHYGAYLLERYSPKVVACFEYYSPLLSCLRLASGGRATVVNIAHSVVPPGDDANMFDADYYFVLGASSVEQARRKAIRIGATRVVPAGYFMIDRDLQIPPSPDRRTLVFFSQLSEELFASGHVAPETRARVVRNTLVVLEFARRHPDFQLLIKPHPLEDIRRTATLVGATTNVRILNKGVGMKEALTPAAAAIVMWSNAALEAAVARRPLIVVDDSSTTDEYLELERYFGSRVRTSEELAARLAALFRSYDSFVQQCNAFVARHLARTAEGVGYLGDCLARLARGERIDEGYEFPEELGGLSVK